MATFWHPTGSGVRVVGRSGGPDVRMPSMQRRAVQLGHDVQHQPGQMIVRQSLAHVWRQQEPLVPTHRTVRARHATHPHASARSTLSTRRSATGSLRDLFVAKRPQQPLEPVPCIEVNIVEVPKVVGHAALFKSCADEKDLAVRLLLCQIYCVA